MNEINSSGGEDPHPVGPATAFTDAWEQTPSLEALRSAVREAARVRPAISRRTGLSGTELDALEVLLAHPTGLAELARLLDVSTAAATGVGDRLESHGHAERRPHPSDRRRTDLHITETGREEVLGHLLPMFIGLARVDAGFTEEERVVVARYLDGAAAAFRAAVDGQQGGADTLAP